MCRFLNTPRFCLVVAFFLITNFYSVLKAQAGEIDSLSIALKKATHDTVKIKLLTQLAEVCEVSNMLNYVEPCLKLCEKAVSEKTSPQLFYLKYLASAINNLGYYQSKQGNPDQALMYYKRALKLFKTLGDKQAIAYSLNNVGYIYNHKGEVTKSLEYYFENLKIQEEIKDTLGIAYSLNNISSVYTSLRSYSKALQYGEFSFEMYERIGHKEGMAMALNNIGLIYFYRKDMPMALSYYEKSLEKYSELNESFGMSSTLNSIGNVYLKLEDNTRALDYLAKSLKIAEDHRYKDIITHCLSSIAEVFIKSGKPVKAESYALRSLKMAEELGNPREIQNSARMLKEIYTAENKFKGAYTMLQLETRMRDSVFNETIRKESISKEIQYEYEKKELQSKLKQEQKLSDLKLENERKNARKNMVMYGLIFLAITLFVSVFYIYKFFKQNNLINANKTNELKQKLLLTQMNPHFIFNSVDNIQSLILQKQDQEAVSYLTKFSKLTRQILENSTENYITLAEELAMTDNYLNIQQLLYNNKFTYSITVDEKIDPESILLPPMLTQPFIENAIKHGLKDKPKGGIISVKFYMTAQSLFYEVTDNGNGFEAKDHGSLHKSLATQIVKERLQNNPSKKEIVISVREIIENNTIKGVQTTFEIPYIYEN